MTFADKLRAVRAREGYSQSTAAQLAEDVPLRTWQEWEQGRQTPPDYTQRLVLAALGGEPFVKLPAARNACPSVRKDAARARSGRKSNDQVEARRQ